MSHGLNLSGGSNMVGLNRIVSRFKPALNGNRFLADLRRGSNSLNSETVLSTKDETVKTTGKGDDPKISILFIDLVI